MIEDFGPPLIERFLRARELRFLVDQDGEFLVDYYGDDVPDYRVQLSAEGPNGKVLCVRIGPATVYPEQLRDRLEGFVAGWNERMRWPKVYLCDDSRGRGIRVIGENSYPLTPGVHRDLLDKLIATSIMAGRQMLVELNSAVGGPTGDELETWLRRTG